MARLDRSLPASALAGGTHAAAIDSPGDQEQADAHASDPYDDADDLFPTETRSSTDPEGIAECRNERDEGAHPDQDDAKSSSCHNAS